MAPADVLKAALPLIVAAEAASAVGASLRLRRDGAAVAPELNARLEAVTDALGIAGGVTALEEHEVDPLLGIVEGFLAQAADFVARPDRGGWNYDEPSILLAQGHMSQLQADVLHRHVVPALGDLAQRLARPEAAFLDVGAGVAAMSVAMCRLWPSLRVVALDPWEPALVLARDKVAAAGLQGRIEVREGIVEDLEHPAGFDLAWVPTFFIARRALEPAIERVLGALRSGGWATFGLYARAGDPLGDALADLRTVRQGGALIAPQEVARLLRRGGFADVEVHFDAAWTLPVMYVAGRRP
jgi:methyltransferase family protein